MTWQIFRFHPYCCRFGFCKQPRLVMDAKVFWGDTNIADPALDRLLQVGRYMGLINKVSTRIPPWIELIAAGVDCKAEDPAWPWCRPSQHDRPPLTLLIKVLLLDLLPPSPPTSLAQISPPIQTKSSYSNLVKPCCSQALSLILSCMVHIKKDQQCDFR